MQFKRLLATLTLALCASVSVQAQTEQPVADSLAVADTLHSEVTAQSEAVRHRLMRKQRGVSNLKTQIVPVGQWVFGGTLSYSTHSNSDYKLLVVEGINSEGYTFKVSPLIGYSVKQNSLIGLRFAYSRSLTDLDKAAVHIGEGDGALNFDFDYYYSLKHSYEVMAIWRQYIPLGRNRRFALFSEFQLTMSGSQSKFAEGSPIRGTYAKGFNVGFGVNPGVVAFITNNMALELNIGVLGINYSTTHQVHNQVTVGDTQSSFMNFSVNIFSIGVGMAFYL